MAGGITLGALHIVHTGHLSHYDPDEDQITAVGALIHLEKLAKTFTISDLTKTQRYEDNHIFVSGMPIILFQFSVNLGSSLIR